MAEKTKLSRNPPEEFVDWLFDYYRGQGYSSWAIHQELGRMLSNWDDNKVYQYWAANVALPGQDPSGLVEKEKEDLGIPSAFDQWLSSKYTHEEVRAWYQGLDTLEKDKTFKWWEKNVKLKDIPAYPGSDVKKQQTILGSLKSLDELNQVLDKWEGSRGFTAEQSQLLLDYFAPIIDPKEALGLSEEELNYLVSSKNDDELADRLGTMGIPEGEFGKYYEGLSAYADTARGAETAAKGRSMSENIDAIARQEKVAYQGEVKRLQEEQEIAPLVAQLQRDPANKQALAEVSPLLKMFESNQYQEGLGEDIYRRLSDIQAQSQRAKQIELLKVNESMRAGDFLAQRYRQLQAPTGVPQPSGASAFEKMLGGSNLAPGTKLRGFMESELAREAQSPGMTKERSDWWAGITPSLWRSGRPQLAQQAIRAVRGQPDITPEELEAKGLRGLYADPLYRLKQDEGEVKKKYYRQPGAGLVGRLTPSLRFR